MRFAMAMDIAARNPIALELLQQRLLYVCQEVLSRKKKLSPKGVSNEAHQILVAGPNRCGGGGRPWQYTRLCTTS
jgi:hypothetical protein